MSKQDTEMFEPLSAPPDAPMERRMGASSPRARGAAERRESIRTALLWITVSVLALAVLTFLVSVNSVISIWFRSQWAPVARSVAALLAILFCLFVMLRLVRRDPGAMK